MAAKQLRVTDPNNRKSCGVAGILTRVHYLEDVNERLVKLEAYTNLKFLYIIRRNFINC